ncbi:MAG: acetyl-CoA carboxylase biotin carboxyl carrier protein subunit [Terriglobia bacterium]
MKFEVEINSNGSRTEHEVEVTSGRLSSEARAGRLEFTLGGECGSADWSEVSTGVYSILLKEKSFEVHTFRSDLDRHRGNVRFGVSTGGVEFDVNLRDGRSRRQEPARNGGDGPQEIRAPMPGRIVKILTSEGQHVKSGDGLLVIEAMKMQNEIRAPRAGRVERVYVSEGEGVETGSRLLRLA